MGLAAIFALIGPLLLPTIQTIQKLFPGAKSDTANNATKKDTVMAAMLPILQALATAGRAPGSVIPAELEAAIEAGLVLLQQTPGALVPPTPNPGTPTPTSVGVVYQIAGTMQVKQ